MNKLSTFRNDELNLKIRAMENEDGSISVNLEDAARGLGFTTVATSGNVVVRWNRVNQYLKEFNVPTCGRDDFIPEPIFYLLAMKANNDTAKKFQIWVATDVLPQVRRTGGYRLPQTPEEKIRLLLEANQSANTKIEKVEERVSNLEDNRFLNPNEYGYLNTQVSSRIREVKDVHQMQLNRRQNSELFKAIGRDIKTITNVRCRSQIRYKDFDKVLDFVKTWEPSKATMVVISQMGAA
ncbi:ORF6C domain-containing protein [Amedibacillus dolichus]|uniref:BRO family, N-terminal domain protein n=1 Tax=Amedibacillus dolichus DSM 3991 TaxID=428127 RepID=A8RCY1_9FIRM|nr:ORF6C domain-containing protein [Amedibacillus dolichus]EDP10935.1 BRO family, N-terminal domain protein [Amedibacillus dolichus DSM 3991]